MTRIAKHLLLQAVGDDLVLVDQQAGTEIVIPNAALDAFFAAVGYFHFALRNLDGEGDDDVPE